MQYFQGSYRCAARLSFVPFRSTSSGHRSGPACSTDHDEFLDDISSISVLLELGPAASGATHANLLVAGPVVVDERKRNDMM